MAPSPMSLAIRMMTSSALCPILEKMTRIPLGSVLGVGRFLWFDPSNTTVIGRDLLCL